MSGNGRGPAALLAGPEPASTRHRATDAVTLLTCYVFLLMAVPSDLVVGPFGAAGAPAALFAAVLLCWYLLARLHPVLRLEPGRAPLRAAAIFFGCAIVAAYVSANRHTMPALEQNGSDRGLILLAGWLGVLLLAADGIDRADRLALLLRRVVLGATAMSVLGIVEFFTGVDATKYIVIPGLSVHKQLTDLMNRDGLVRATATAAQPLEFASVLAMSLPLAIHQARFAPPGRRRRRWLQVALVAGAMPMTVSRSGLFGLAVVGIAVLPTWPRRDRRRAYLAASAAPVAVWLARPSLLASFGRLFGQIGTDGSSASRAGAYSAAVPFIGQHPWFGRGFQTFFPQTYFFVDNQYLTSLIETGAVGAAALAALFAAGWFTARSARFAAADAAPRDLAQCLAASVAAAAVSFATFDALSFTIASGLCFLLLGCAGAAWRLARAQRASQDH
jgi:O-antigen ligase